MRVYQGFHFRTQIKGPCSYPKKKPSGPNRELSSGAVGHKGGLGFGSGLFEIQGLRMFGVGFLGVEGFRTNSETPLPVVIWSVSKSRSLLTFRIL